MTYLESIHNQFTVTSG